MLSCAFVMLTAVSAYQLTSLQHTLPRATRLLRVTAMVNETPADEAERTIPGEDAVFVARFAHVKQSLSMFLKFALIGGMGADGWVGTGELEALHAPSGTTASILIDVEQSTVSLISPSAAASGSSSPLNEYAVALLDELETLAKTEEAEAADRLCFPADAVDAARLALSAACARREAAGSFSGRQEGAPSPSESSNQMLSPLLRKEVVGAASVALCAVQAFILWKVV